MPDLFEEFGESLTPKWKQREEAKAAAKEAKRAAMPPMVKRGLEKKQEEKAKQLVRYREWKKEVKEGMSRGDYGDEIIDLFKRLRHPDKAAELVDYVLNAKWMLLCSMDTRTTLLGYIDHMLVRHNIRMGYPPIDDSLPEWMGDTRPPNAFQVIRKYLTGV